MFMFIRGMLAVLSLSASHILAADTKSHTAAVWQGASSNSAAQ